MGEHEYLVAGDGLFGWSARCRCGYRSIAWSSASLALGDAGRHALTVETIGMAA